MVEKEEVVQNFIALQDVLSKLAEKVDNLTSHIDKLLLLFETSAKAFLEHKEEPMDVEFKEAIKNLLEQNKIIAKSLTILEERTRQPVQQQQPMQQQQMQQQYQQPYPPQYPYRQQGWQGQGQQANNYQASSNFQPQDLTSKKPDAGKIGGMSPSVPTESIEGDKKPKPLPSM